MHTIRQDLKGDFVDKVRQLDDLTKLLSAKQEKLELVVPPVGKNWTKIVMFCLLAFLFMVLGHAILSYLPLPRNQYRNKKKFLIYINVPSFLMIVDDRFSGSDGRRLHEWYGLRYDFDHLPARQWRKSGHCKQSCTYGPCILEWCFGIQSSPIRKYQ